MRGKGTRADLSVFDVGQLVTLLPESHGHAMVVEQNGVVEQKGYSSRVEGVMPDALLVTWPAESEALIELPQYSEISAYFLRRGARYCFRATIAALQRSPVPAILLTDIGKATKDERRFHVRVDTCLQPLEIVERDDPNAKPLDGTSSIVVNISAGGLGIVCRRPLAEGAIVKVAVELPKGFGPLNVEAEVVRCTQMDVRGMRKWKVGLAFLKMDGADHDRVTAFVLKQQQALRRRGLL